MHTYSFRIKKGQYQLDVITSDKELLVEQFELWVRQSSDYVRRKKAKDCKQLVNNQILAEEEITKKNVEAFISKKQEDKKEEIITTKETKIEKAKEKKKSNE